MDPWQITTDDRAKYDAQFMQLSPVNGFITGDQAKHFFLQSGLTPQILAQIWALADYNNDGRMDRKEFSIAMFLIKRRLQGLALPSQLPSSLMGDPVAATCATPGSPLMRPHAMPSAAAAAGVGGISIAGAQTLPRMFPTNFGSPANSAAAPGSADVIMGSAARGHNKVPPGVSSGPVPPGQEEWSIPNQARLRYRQQFNQLDRAKRGFLLGLEAKSVLTQSGLPNPLLAQIWTLSDIDKDGKLTCDEFCLAMHLAEMARLGHSLPSQLPSSLVPPSYRSPGGVGSTATNRRLSTTSSGTNDDTEENKAPPTPITIEDKRRENFLKGQAELERRQAALREQMRKEEEERIAKERAEQERQERLRLEKERQRQAELERHRERQRALEADREEHRRRAAEERERARREMERQRLLEAEKKRTEAAVQDKHRAQASLEQSKAKEANMRQELENLESRRRDGCEKLDQSRAAVAEYKNRIEAMRATRDKHISEIETLQSDIESAKSRLHMLQREREELSLRVQTIFESNPTAEQHKALRTNYEAKKNAHEKLRKQIQDLQDELNMKGQELAGTRNKLSVQERQYSSLQRQLKSLRHEVRDRWSEWQRKKTTMPNGTSSGHEFSPVPPASTAASQPSKHDSFSAIWNTADSSGSKSPAFPPSDFDAAFDSAFGNVGAAASAGPVAGARGGDVKVSGFETDPFATQDPFSDGVAVAGSAIAGEHAPVDDPFASEDPFAGEANPFSEAGAVADPFASTDGDPFSAPGRPAKPPSDAGSAGFDAVFGSDKDGAKNSSVSSAVTQKSDRNDPFADLGVNFGNTPSPFAAAFESAARKQQPPVPSAASANDPFATTDVSGAGLDSVGFDSPSGAFPSPSVDWASAFADAAKPTSEQKETKGGAPFNSVGTENVMRRERRYKAAYSFEARQSDELTFPEGAMLLVAQGEDEKGREWWTGRLEGADSRRGIFPSSYVRPVNEEEEEENEYNEIEPPSGPEDYGVLGETTSTRPPVPEIVPPKADMVESLYPWESNAKGHLSFPKGAQIRVLERHDDWWMGELNSQTGWFPKTYVKPAGENSLSAPSSELPPADYANVPDVIAARAAANAAPAAAAPPPEPAEAPSAAPKAAPPPALPAVTSPPPGAATPSPAEPQSPIAHAVAVFPYVSNVQGDLVFEKGEQIAITKKDGDWWTGRIGQRAGLFPKNFVAESPTLGSPAGQAPEPPGSSGVSSLAQLHHQQQSQQRSETPTSVASDAIYGVLGGKRPPVAKVIAPYTATGPEQISLVPGQLIQVRKKSPSGWWEGEVQQRGQQRRLGWFPANYVRVLEAGGDASSQSSSAPTGARPSSSIAAPFPQKNVSAAPPTPTSTSGGPTAPTTTAPAPPVLPAGSSAAPNLERVIALYSYRAQNPDELSFPKGATIIVLGKNEQEWWPGRLEDTGVEGVFPVNYVQLLQSDKTGPAGGDPMPPAKSSLAPGSGDLEVVVSLYAHVAQNEDELSFAAGARIAVLSRNEREWWRGRNEESGQVGMFPVNYVRPFSAPAGHPGQGRPKS